MANTTNYNWETPDDTDLVKDGASAIRTLGSSIDTTTKALNPSTTLGDLEYRSATANTNARLAIGTTGQILSVVGGVPAWVANDVGDITAVTAGTGISGGGTSGDVTITNSMATAIDAKGDLIAGTGADTFSRLAVGTNGHTLVADSSTATGLKYQAPTVNTVIDAAGDLLYGTAADTVGRLAIGTAGQVLAVNSGATAPEWTTPAAGGGMTLLSTTTLSGASTSISITPTGYTYIDVLIKNAYASNNDTSASFRLNSDSGSNYTYHSIRYDGATLLGTSGFSATQNFNLMVNLPTSAAIGRANNAHITIYTPNATDDFYMEYESIGGANAQGNPGGGSNRAIYNASAALSNLTILVSSGTFSGGTVEIYGVK